MAQSDPIFTLIGDLVGSRGAADRPQLQQTLGESLMRMNEALEPVLALEPTIGDEFQGGFDSVAGAVRASLLVRLELLRVAEVDTRYGLGYGAITVFSDRSPVSQDGPGWWTARSAIDRASELAAAPHTSFARTCFEHWPEDAGVSPMEGSALNAFLICRDAMVDRMNAPSRRRLFGLLRGWSQSKIALEEGTTQGAISQNLARSGAFAIQAAQERLKEQSG